MRDRPAWLWAGLVAFGAILVLLGVNVVAVLSKPSDEEQLKQAMDEMRSASLDGRPGGVLERLSSSFQLPLPFGTEVRSAQAEVAKFIRQAKIRHLTLDDIRTEVQEDTAIVRCRLTTDFEYLGNRLSLDIPDLEVEFRREVRRRLFVIPDPSWLVVGFGPIDSSKVDFGF